VLQVRAQLRVGGAPLLAHRRELLAQGTDLVAQIREPRAVVAMAAEHSRAC
jgi:hypothetical protein